MKLWKLSLLCVSLLGVGAAAGAAAGYFRWHRVSPRPFQVRELAIKHHAAEMLQGATIALGDSLIERQRVDDLCGPTLNAGVGSAQVVDLAPLVPDLVVQLKPRLIVTEIGTNDLYYSVPIDTFTERYRSLLRSAAPTPVIVVGIPGAPGQYDEANRALQKMALEEGAHFVPGMDTTDLTSDGVHFDEEGGRRWKASVRQACDEVLG